MMETHIWRTGGIRSRPIPVVIFAEPKQRAFSLGLECLDAMKASIPDHHVSVFKRYLNDCLTDCSSYATAGLSFNAPSLPVDDIYESILSWAIIWNNFTPHLYVHIFKSSLLGVNVK